MAIRNGMCTFASRLNPAHWREVDNYARCPYRWFLDFQERRGADGRALGAAPSLKWFQAIALRRTIADLHASETWDDFEGIYRAHWDALAAARGEALRAGSDEEGKGLHEESLTILAGYSARSENRRARVLCSDTSFLVKIGKYWFRGTVDQVRKVASPRGRPVPAYQIVHFGTGRRPPQRILNHGHGYRIAAVAMAQGSFFHRRKAYTTVIRFNRFPLRTTHYQLSDHLPLKRSVKESSTGLVRGRGEPRGDCVRACQYRPGWREELERDLARIVRAVRMKVVYRAILEHGTCNGFCPYTEACLGDTR